MVSCFVWWLTALLPSFHKLRFLSFLALLCFVVFSSITISLCFNHGEGALRKEKKTKIETTGSVG